MLNVKEFLLVVVYTICWPIWQNCQWNDLSGCGFHSLKCLVNVDLIIFMCGWLWYTLLHYRLHCFFIQTTHQRPGSRQLAYLCCHTNVSKHRSPIIPMTHGCNPMFSPFLNVKRCLKLRVFIAFVSTTCIVYFDLLLHDQQWS